VQQDYNLGTYAKNPYAAGQQRYGLSASSAPTSGRLKKDGYIDRERRNKLKKQIYLRWMQDNSTGRYNSPGALRRGM
jgi:hypothetical protein